MFTTHRFSCLGNLCRAVYHALTVLSSLLLRRAFWTTYDALRRPCRIRAEPPLGAVTNPHFFPPGSRWAHWLVLTPRSPPPSRWAHWLVLNSTGRPPSRWAHWLVLTPPPLPSPAATRAAAGSSCP